MYITSREMLYVNRTTGARLAIDTRFSCCLQIYALNVPNNYEKVVSFKDFLKYLISIT